MSPQVLSGVKVRLLKGLELGWAVASGPKSEKKKALYIYILAMVDLSHGGYLHSFCLGPLHVYNEKDNRT